MKNQACSIGEAIAYIEFHIIKGIITGAKDYLLFHGAAVCKINKAGLPKAFILLGGPGSGKSLFCYDSVSKGYCFLSDEIILYNIRTYKIELFPRAILIKGVFPLSNIQKEKTIKLQYLTVVFIFIGTWYERIQSEKVLYLNYFFIAIR